VPKKISSKNVAYEGQIIRVEATNTADGRIFEKASRSPGTRIIIYDEINDQILLSQEYRPELGETDYRLPGGKVRDKIRDWDEIKDRPDVLSLIGQACMKEAREEVGMEVENIELFTNFGSGGPTIGWDLYYFVATKFKALGKQQLETEEDIKAMWVSSAQAAVICLSGQMREGRSVAALSQFLYQKGKIQIRKS
jgi:8-oxo-dGTP pyrophosphatase MutT (NUDIX family)